MSIPSVIALNRFGLGARPGEIAQIAADPRGWLNGQIRPNTPLPAVMQSLPDTNNARLIYKTARVERKQAAAQGGAAASNDAFRRLAFSEVAAKFHSGIGTATPLYERLVMFWANHFTVSALKGRSAAIVGSYEREAIRPHVFGSFRTMLRAAALHPAMLLYLDNQVSVGPNSAAVSRLDQARRGDGQQMAAAMEKRGLNENLSREIVELHTLGVNGGYTQADVTNFAKVLTGWTVRPPEARVGTEFIPSRHEPGPQIILGRRFAEGGQEQALAVLDFLATHPSTARHVATKLARHFIADQPPEPAVKTLAGVFMQTGGDLAQVTRALINLNEPWQQPFAKFKRPDEYLISVCRALSETSITAPNLVSAMIAMGMRPFSAPSPQGWPDTAAEWAGSDALWKRIEWAIYVTRNARYADARQLMTGVLGQTASARTQAAVNGADSPAQALALLFASPEFMRR